MRDFALSTRTTAILAAIVLATPLLAGVMPAEPQTPTSTPAKPYCSAEICASATYIAQSKLEVGPDFVVHRFTLKDGSTAGVYVGGYPQRPAADTPSRTETIDGVACERFDLREGAPSIAIYCKWRDDFPTIIHAWAGGSDRPAATQAMSLVRSLRRCNNKTECPWPQ